MPSLPLIRNCLGTRSLPEQTDHGECFLTRGLFGHSYTIMKRSRRICRRSPRPWGIEQRRPWLWLRPRRYGEGGAFCKCICHPVSWVFHVQPFSSLDFKQYSVLRALQCLQRWFGNNDIRVLLIIVTDNVDVLFLSLMIRHDELPIQRTRLLHSRDIA